MVVIARHRAGSHLIGVHYKQFQQALFKSTAAILVTFACLPHKKALRTQRPFFIKEYNVGRVCFQQQLKTFLTLVRRHRAKFKGLI